jgi:hypothetical protein
VQLLQNPIQTLRGVNISEVGFGKHSGLDKDVCMHSTNFVKMVRILVELLMENFGFR